MNVKWDYKLIGDVLQVERGGSPRPISKYLTDSADGINWIKISDATASDKYIYKTKQKISKAMSGKNHPLYGKPCPEERKRRISEANKGRTAWNKGKKNTNIIFKSDRVFRCKMSYIFNFLCEYW